MGFLTSFVPNGEIGPSLDNSRTTREEKSTQFLTGTIRTLFQRILETKIRKLEKH